VTTAEALPEGTPIPAPAVTPEGSQDPAADARAAAAKAKKKREKVRSAWISFVGRIVAQLVGAAATIALGLMVVQRYQAGAVKSDSAAARTGVADAQSTRARPGSDARPSVVVLPLVNFSADAALQPYADGLTEALLTELTKAGRVRVLSRTSSMHYKGTSKRLPEIARELDVDLVLEGSLMRSRGRVRISAQLIDAMADEHVWAQSCERDADDVFEVQSAVARLIAQELFSLEENTSATTLDFVHRSMAAEALAPGRDRGVMIHGRPWRRLFTYEIGLFEHDGRNARPGSRHRVSGSQTVAGRVSARPLRRQKSGGGDLRVGFAMTRSELPEGLSGLSGRTVFGERFHRADALVRGSRQRVGLELQWRLGRTSVTAEYMRLTDERLGQSVENTDLSPLVATGWYASGTRILVDRKRWAHSLELAGRIEGLAFNGASLVATPSASPRADVVPGNRDIAVTLGMNWSPLKWVRIQANVIREAIAFPGREQSFPAPFWSQAFRFQLAI
jgi:TolB-like protein